MKFLINQLMNSTITSRSKLVLFLITFFSSIVITSEPAQANRTVKKCVDIASLPEKISDGSFLDPDSTIVDGERNVKGCTITPSVYKVKAFELGICKDGEDPFSTTGLDTSGCHVLWSATNGEEFNLVNTDGTPAVFPLTENTVNEPPIGTYKHAYVIIDDTIKLAATLTLSGETWKTASDVAFLEHRTSGRDEGPTASVGRANSSDAAEEVDTRVGYMSETTGCYVEDFSLPGSSDTISGIMLKSDKSTIADNGSSDVNFGGTDFYCAGSKFIGGVQTLSTPIVITEATESGTLVFDTTDTGVWVGAYNYTGDNIPDEGDGGSFRPYFDMGPFVVRFTVN